ncbi:MAG: ankyrin repeat domain-containing protein [Phycisphaerae bacterium]|nr:ankyrin repeat domain-containing protein [Phycisphaerae bacterium]
MSNFFKIFIVIVLALFLSSCDKKQEDSLNKMNENSRNITNVQRNQELDFINSVGMDMLCLSEEYWVSKHETTQQQFMQIMGYNPSIHCGVNHPVENLTSLEAIYFCRRLSEIDRVKGVLPQGYAYCLPSFSEWQQYVADASLRGSIIMDVSKGGKFKYISLRNQTPASWEIGNGEVNRLGIYDLRGNVKEFSRDESGDGGKFIFGASFRESRDDYLSINNRCSGGGKDYSTGFRCVLIRTSAADIDNTSLHEVAILGDLKQMRKIFEEQGDPNTAQLNIYKETPLHVAVLQGQVGVIKELLINGADVNAKTADGALPIHYACGTGNVEMVKLLLENNAELNPGIYREMNCMHLAFKTCNIELIKILVAAGFKDDLDWSPHGTVLMMAMADDKLKIA